jgi:hypothetical protein
VTAYEPGDKDVLTYSLTFNPFSIALLATRPAASIAPGLDVLVQEVIAAITTEPCFSDYVVSSGFWTLNPLNETG